MSGVGSQASHLTGRDSCTSDGRCLMPSCTSCGCDCAQQDQPSLKAELWWRCSPSSLHFPPPTPWTQGLGKRKDGGRTGHMSNLCWFSNSGGGREAAIPLGDGDDASGGREAFVMQMICPWTKLVDPKEA